MPFEVWQAGPVVKDLFIDLSETPVIMDGYVEKEVVDDKTYIKATTTFSDDEFSDNDITVMDDILRRYGKKTAKQLVELTHRKDGLWYATAERNNLLEGFEQKVINNSDCQIDLGECLVDCCREFYNEQMDFLKMTRAYGV
ncbi:MAG: SocA family protein [Bacteroidales bacterium]|nr:SocA family protein [Bacteroidales bacterium]